MKTLRHILFLTLTINVGLLAQDKVVTGKVVDASTKEPLPFTNIGVKGEEQGTVSNSEGTFVLSFEELQPTDSVFFSFVGYKQKTFTIEELRKNTTVMLSPNAVLLSGISISSREYSPLEILDSAKAHFDDNHINHYQKYRVFSRDASNTDIHKCDVEYKKSSFKAINKKAVEDFNKEMPENLNVYSDYLVDVLYSEESRADKVVPIEGQSLIENWNFNDEFNDRVKMFVGDVEDNVRNEDNYFKVRSGVFAGKLDLGHDSAFIMTDDSLHYIMSTNLFKGDYNYLLKQYSTIFSKRWDFFHEYKWYDYDLRDISIVNNELAYIVDFKPHKNKAKYKGTICIATGSFAILQVDYAFDVEKDGKGVSLLGVDYLVENRSGRAIFEKGDSSYHLKYLARESEEHFAIDRNLTLKQKRESGLFDKTLQEVKVKMNMDLTLVQKKEVLVVSHKKITPKEFEATKQPNTMIINKVDAYSPHIWKNSSIIEPTKALKEYRQQY